MTPQELKACKRIRLITYCLSAIVIIIIGRAFYLQVITNSKWTDLAERQYHKTIRDKFPRGTIYDQNNEPMAISIEVDTVYLQPNQQIRRFDKDKIQDKIKEEAKRQEVAKVLATTLSLSLAEMKGKLHSE